MGEFSKEFKSAEEAEAARQFDEQMVDKKKPVRPGGPLKGRPVQGPESWYNQYGEKISGHEARDLEYSAKFWQRKQPEGQQQIMMEIVENAAQKGEFATAASAGSLSEADKERLSAYRQLAKGLGYEIGDFKYHPHSHTVTATIRKI